ncbi:MAG: sulfite exporter TauE/SafE family protein [Elusimicrobia bacterium]|nr:sulfite exporter TauE/SafE family protein [Elusimicrobiota bacterium]
MTLLRLAGLLATGAAAGLVGNLLGLGGGIFIVPALVLVFNVPAHAAVATGLVAVIATSSAGGGRNAATGLANVRLGMILEPATVLGAICGALLAHQLSETVLLGLFAGLLLAVGAGLWRRPRGNCAEPPAGGGGLLDGEYHDGAAGGIVRYSVRRVPAALGASFGAGLMSALLGVGGGIVKVPALHMFCGVPMKAAVATSNFMIGVTAAASAAVYFQAGYVPALAAAAMSLGVLAGSPAGVWLVRRLREAALRRVFAVVTVVIAAALLRRLLAG